MKFLLNFLIYVVLRIFTFALVSNLLNLGVMPLCFAQENDQFSSWQIMPTTSENCFDVRDGVILQYRCTDPKVKIPKTIRGQTITAIGKNAFFRKHINIVKIPSTVTLIDSLAFAFNDLTFIHLPSGLNIIGTGAFNGNLLSTLEIPSHVLSIGASAFNGNRLSSVKFSNGLKSIGAYAFFRNQLSSLEIPESVMSLGEGAFFGNQLTWISFLGSPQIMGKNCFADNFIATFTFKNASSAFDLALLAPTFVLPNNAILENGTYHLRPPTDHSSQSWELGEGDTESNAQEF